MLGDLLKYVAHQRFRIARSNHVHQRRRKHFVPLPLASQHRILPLAFGYVLDNGDSAADRSVQQQWRNPRALLHVREPGVLYGWGQRDKIAVQGSREDFYFTLERVTKVLIETPLPEVWNGLEKGPPRH